MLLEYCNQGTDVWPQVTVVSFISSMLKHTPHACLVLCDDTLIHTLLAKKQTINTKVYRDQLV